MRFFALLLLFTSSLFAERGIVVTCPDKYAPYLIVSLQHLRKALHSTLPVEVWYAGSELSSEYIQALESIPDVATKNVLSVLPPPAKQYQGWHLKPLVMQICRFDEVILMDADLFFFQDPRVLFEHPGYKNTGAFFFRDRKIYVVPFQAGKKRDPGFAQRRGSVPYYLETRKYFRTLVKEPSSSMPEDWKHYWSEELPTIDNPYTTEKQESGCIALDKRRHQEGLKIIIALNSGTRPIYQYIHGDKETYWIGLEMAGEPYYVNSRFPMMLVTAAGKALDIVQFVDNRLFYQQKWPHKVKKGALLLEEFGKARNITDEEQADFARLYQTVESYTSFSTRLYYYLVPWAAR